MCHINLSSISIALLQQYYHFALSIFIYACLSVCPSVCLSVSLGVALFVSIFKFRLRKALSNGNNLLQCFGVFDFKSAQQFDYLLTLFYSA